MPSKYRKEHREEHREEHPSSFDNFSQLPAEEQTRTPKMISAEAKKLKHWVFDPVTKDWYTPEEFLTKHERLVKGGEAIFARVQIKDPIQAIEEAHEKLIEHPDKLAELSKRICEFSLRVVKYYRGG